MKSRAEMESFIKKLGFRIDHAVPEEILPLKNGEIGYGCLATKV
jgi:hypothetical protein